MECKYKFYFQQMVMPFNGLRNS